jgi:hypothetical protein
MPPVELPISVNHFSNLPASYGEASTSERGCTRGLCRFVRKWKKSGQWYQADDQIPGQKGVSENNLVDRSILLEQSCM